jgi:hypothetical protein
MHHSKLSLLVALASAVVALASSQNATALHGSQRELQGCKKSMPPLPGKKGIGLTMRDPGQEGSYVENLPKVVALKVYWNYAWGLDRPVVQPDNIEFVPMVWGAPKNLAKLQDDFKTKLQPQIDKGQVKRLLGFNEPDNEDQSNMTVEEAINAWPYLEAMGLPLVSPSAEQPTGTWMQTAMSAKTYCQPQWIGVHWYGPASFSSFKSSMTRVYNLYRRPIIITEFAPADWTASTPEENIYSDSQILSFMKQALPWLQKTSWIVGYSWFSYQRSNPAGTHSALFEENGDLTELGRFYASVRTNKPRGNQ